MDVDKAARSATSVFSSQRQVTNNEAMTFSKLAVLTELSSLPAEKLAEICEVSKRSQGSFEVVSHKALDAWKRWTYAETVGDVRKMVEEEGSPLSDELKKTIGLSDVAKSYYRTASPTAWCP